MDPESVDRTRYPFSIRAFADGIDIELTTDVTFFVGENGSGKSTLLEAIATRCGFKDFLACPERYFQHLFPPDDEEGSDPRKR